MKHRIYSSKRTFRYSIAITTLAVSITVYVVRSKRKVQHYVAHPNRIKPLAPMKLLQVPEMKRSGNLAAVKVEKKDDDGKPPANKPAAAAGEHITLKVLDTDGRAVYRTMRRTDQLQALMDFYYDRVPTVARGSGRFLYDGRRLCGWQTPAGLAMADGDEVDFFTELLGGAA